jgi:hypothetical protein
MSEKLSEKSKMSSVEFVQFALRERVAPPSLGSTKARLRHASIALRWSASRTKDAWYADPRISISADELREVEEHTGLRYGRKELAEIDAYIAKATALLEGPDEDFHRPFRAALRSFFGALARPGTDD